MSNEQTPSPARKSKPSTGIRALAASLGLSVSTVSRAINNRYGVDAQTRERVLEGARQIGYVPDAAARKLKAYPRLRVEVLFSPFYGADNQINPAALATVRTLRQRAAERDILLTVNELSNFQSPAEIAADLKMRIAEQSFDVAVTYGSFNPMVLDALRESGCPVVCLQSREPFERCVHINVDTQAAAYQATQYLAALGHHNIGIVAGESMSEHHRNYQKGFDLAVEEFGLHVKPSWRFVLPAAELNAASAERHLVPLLSAAATERPSAMIFASDWLALGGIAAAKKANLTLPNQLSVIGFDNIDAAPNQTPALTTFDVHHGIMADRVLDGAICLMEAGYTQIADENRSKMIVADIVKRASCQLLRSTATA